MKIKRLTLVDIINIEFLIDYYLILLGPEPESYALKTVYATLFELKFKVVNKRCKISNNGFLLKLKPAEKYALYCMRNDEQEHGTPDQANSCTRLLTMNNNG